MAECGDLQCFNNCTTIRVRSGGSVDGCVATYSLGNEPYRCRTPALELETCESLIRSVDLSPRLRSRNILLSLTRKPWDWAYAYLLNTIWYLRMGLIPNSEERKDRYDQGPCGCRDLCRNQLA